MSTHVYPDTDPISAALLFGNPTTACSGMGVCHLKPAPQAVGGGNTPGISVEVTTDDPSGTNANLIINISADSMTSLMEAQMDIYLALVNAAADGSGFNADATAMPFLIDSTLVQGLWPGMANSPTPIGYIPRTAVSWSVTGEVASVITITVPTVSFGATSPINTPNQVAVGPQSITIGNWTIATDAYGNLCFSSTVGSAPVNQIVFGVNGSMSINAQNVITDNSPIYISNNGQGGAVLDATQMGIFSNTAFDGVYQPSDWIASTYWGKPTGTDQDSNLVIHLGNPFPTV